MILNNPSLLMYISLLFLSAVNSLSFRISNYRLSWANCGPVSDPAQLKSLTINPDPIRVPGNITVTGSVGIASQIPTDVHASVYLQRKVGPFFVKVPCVENFGSCTYDNVCDLWATYCPKYASKYGLPYKHVPPELLGEYRATVDITSSEGHLACVDIDLTIKR
ncbi:unnamed protein product [Rotaria socialis]